MAENDALTMDKKAFMKGKVVNKVARWNLCFADEDQEPNYDDGKGRVVAWQHIPRMAQIRQVISEWTEDVLLNGEANYYYDISQCGIGFHGDGERRKVFAVRMGETMPLYFKWYQNSEPVGEPFELILNDGDMYIMSEKAVGFDWLKKKIPTLRHSTGCAKFTGIKLGLEIELDQEKEAAVEQKKAAAKQKEEQKKAAAKQKEDEKKQQKEKKESDAFLVKCLLEDAKASKLAQKEKEKALKLAEKEKEKALKLAEKEKEKALKLVEKEQKKKKITSL
jgi:hypothetical protein